MNNVAPITKHEGGTQPQTINAAIVAVMSQIKRLEKADQNTFGKYAFTSVDDFKDALRPLMAENGLVPSVDEISFEFKEVASGKDKITALAVYKFAIQLKHDSGECTDPENITIALPFTGAQSTGAARSYALKEWMKGRFLVSTGDRQDEADERENSEYTQNRMTKADARETFATMQKELRKVEDLKDSKAVEKFWIDNQSIIKAMPQDWSKMLIVEVEEAHKKAKAEEELDKMSNDELDAATIARDGP